MSQKRILLVEDEAWWQKFVTQALEGLDIELVIASDYGEGMQALRNGPYDLLILDNNLKQIRGGGIELLQAARRFLLRPMPPAFVHSADLTPQAEEQVRVLGAEYFKKQESREKLKEIVVRLLVELA